MHVLFVASEVAPWIKVGGLADVVGSLPGALREIGIDARICVPAHARVLSRAPDPRWISGFEVHTRDGTMRADVYETRLGEVPVYLIGGPPIPSDEGAYSGRMAEEGDRYTFFSLAVVELLSRLEPKVDVVHAHDWHAALTPWLISGRRHWDAPMRGIATMLSVHNLPYAGHGTDGALSWFGISGTDDHRLPPNLRYVPLGLGLVSADTIGTVSPGYAREILTPEHGHGFEHLLQSRRADLTGILNGLDMRVWDPANDAALETPFSAADRSGRTRCRAQLARELEIDPTLPIVGIVSRFAHQKGIDVAVSALRSLESGFSAAILGEGEPHLEYEARRLAQDLPGRVAATVGFDGTLARRIYAGADLLLLPSRYEPCGMAQMIAMRYGCVPVAAETGGLADTVRDLDLSEAPTGFLFPDATSSGATFALRRALASYGRPNDWNRLMRHGMNTDFSWRASARVYVESYERSIQRRAEG